MEEKNVPISRSVVSANSATTIQMKFRRYSRAKKSNYSQALAKMDRHPSGGVGERYGQLLADDVDQLVDRIHSRSMVNMSIFRSSRADFTLEPAELGTTPVQTAILDTLLDDSGSETSHSRGRGAGRGWTVTYDTEIDKLLDVGPVGDDTVISILTGSPPPSPPSPPSNQSVKGSVSPALKTPLSPILGSPARSAIHSPVQSPKIRDAVRNLKLDFKKLKQSGVGMGTGGGVDGGIYCDVTSGSTSLSDKRSTVAGVGGLRAAIQRNRMKMAESKSTPSLPRSNDVYISPAIKCAPRKHLSLIPDPRLQSVTKARRLPSSDVRKKVN
eukprot:CAMPEP_0182418638 /NCGR_PEP_ID=MMETSP1167-20130531/3020_1 /TAXON_ID=2988 /ORGANISM="Mallomonas Sp, Strain CCMP3275" /LENGTH=326 /DNA_ID=CAMNT_0024592935 /DNA_START=148 /DNA_END=1130 /DNA_ORIENTATION=-